jgi:hypothetical protein
MNKIEPFSLFMLHHAAQKKAEQGSIKIKVIKIRKKLQNMCIIDNFVHLKYALAGSESPDLFTYM